MGHEDNFIPDGADRESRLDLTAQVFWLDRIETPDETQCVIHEGWLSGGLSR